LIGRAYYLKEIEIDPIGYVRRESVKIRQESQKSMDDIGE